MNVIYLLTILEDYLTDVFDQRLNVMLVTKVCFILGYIQFIDSFLGHETQVPSNSGAFPFSAAKMKLYSVCIILASLIVKPKSKSQMQVPKGPKLEKSKKTDWQQKEQPGGVHYVEENISMSGL